MRKEQFEEQIAAYLEGSLTAEDLVPFEAAMRGDPELSALVENYRVLAGEVRGNPLAIESSVQENVEAEPTTFKERLALIFSARSLLAGCVTAGVAAAVVVHLGAPAAPPVEEGVPSIVVFSPIKIPESDAPESAGPRTDGEWDRRHAFGEPRFPSGEGSPLAVTFEALGAEEGRATLLARCSVTAVARVEGVHLALEFAPATVARVRALDGTMLVPSPSSAPVVWAEGDVMEAGRQFTSVFRIELVPGAVPDLSLVRASVRYREPGGAGTTHVGTDFGAESVLPSPDELTPAFAGLLRERVPKEVAADKEGGRLELGDDLTQRTGEF